MKTKSPLQKAKQLLAGQIIEIESISVTIEQVKEAEMADPCEKCDFHLKCSEPFFTVCYFIDDLEWGMNRLKIVKRPQL